MSLIAGGLLNIGSKLIERLIPDKTKQVQAKQELARMQIQGDLKEMEISMSAIVAEAKSQDKWTSRARPSFLYVMYTIIILCFIGGILGIWWPEEVKLATDGITDLLAAIPNGMWTTFTLGYLGYAGARSYDKTKLMRLNK